MPTRRLPLILPLLALPSLLACDAAEPANPAVDQAATNGISASPGVSRARLASAVDSLFADEAAGETRALLVLRGGEVIAERYAPGYGRDTRFLGWSMSKTITGLMIGLLVADGRLRLDETPPIPVWQRAGDPRGEITLRQLLQMRSGLRHTEETERVYDADTVRMLFLDGRDDMAAYAEAQPLEAEPGRKWEYSSATTVILADLAARSLTSGADPAERRRAVGDYLRTRIFDPLGMKSMVPEFDTAGTLIGGSLIHGTARDWARFGEFLRNKGAVKGVQLVPTAWIAFMTSPNPRNPGYGAQTWLNRPQAEDGRIEWPGLPASAFSMNGHLAQYVLVVPDRGITIIRLGKTQDGEGRHVPVRAAIARIAQLFPKEPAT